MYVSLKWVQSILNLKELSLLNFCNKLTVAGFEIEEVQKKFILDEIDFILDISLTANRSDITNIKGFIQELRSIFFKQSYKDSFKLKEIDKVNFSSLKKRIMHSSVFIWEHFLQKETFYSNLNQGNKDLIFEKCCAFISIEVFTLKVKASPQWLQKYLLSSNINPINNILDTINFVTLETGYPFFACDLIKLKKYLKTSTIKFSTRYASIQQKFQIEPNKTIILQPNNLLLYANETPISVIGFLTVREIEINENTTDLLIYGGLFDPLQIRKSAQILGFRTEQSRSLEKHLNFNGLEQAFIRLSILFRVQGINFILENLINIHRIHTMNKPSFINYIENKRPLLNLNYKEVTNLLGSSSFLEKGNILNILKALHFKILIEAEDCCKLNIPFSREFDLEREVDLIEEIVRISGFTSFSSFNFKKIQQGKISKLEKLKRLLRKIFIDLGFNEVLHYSTTTFQTKTQVELKNPIVPENNCFRISLLNQLIQKSGLNTNKKNKTFEAFEIGRIYTISNSGNIIETELISGIFGGKSYHSEWNGEEKIINWFEAKGIMDHFFKILDLPVSWSKLSNKNEKFFHTGRCAELSINKQLLGKFGQIHPVMAKTHALLDQTFLFEFNLSVLEKLWEPKQISMFKQYSQFPATLIDLAFIKNDKICFKDVETKIIDIGGPLLESIQLFDYYSGVPIPVGYHSLGFKLKFRDFNKTLTNEEVDFIVKKIIKALEKDFGIVIRQS
jgi:phenylalanyl-tRNA synthetase beta chain